MQSNLLISTTQKTLRFFAVEQKTDLLLDKFCTNIINHCNDSLNQFSWVPECSYYHTDQEGNIFYTRNDCYGQFTQDPKFKANYLLRNQVCTWEIPEKFIFDVKAVNGESAYRMTDYFKSVGLKHVAHPCLLLSEKNSQLEKELLNCGGFVTYILTKSLAKPNDNYHELAQKISPIVWGYFNNGYNILNRYHESVAQKTIQPGDLIYFYKSRYNNMTHRTDTKGFHVGIFFGYDENNAPLLCDLFYRDHDRTSNVQLVSFNKHKQYTDEMEILTLPLEKLYLELEKALSAKPQSTLKI